MNTLEKSIMADKKANGWVEKSDFAKVSPNFPNHDLNPSIPISMVSVEKLRKFLEYPPYFVMEIMVNEYGDGPVEIQYAKSVTYEVWDAVTFETVTTHAMLSSACRSSSDLNMAVVAQNIDKFE